MDNALWPAPVAATPLDADVRIPGSKSLTNRALVLAALADGPSVIQRPLDARDTRLMAAALRAMGTVIESTGNDLTVTPGKLHGPASVDCGLAGTVMRFVPPVATLAHGEVAFDGDPYARERPMDTIIGALRGLGARIDDGGRGALPFTVHGAGALRGGDIEIDASSSSQFVSALLLSGARFDQGVTVHHVGKPVPSLPHIEMTIAMLRERGVEVDDSDANTWRVAPGAIAAKDVDIEPDLSNAAPFLAAAMVTGGRVRVLGWPEHTTQPGGHLQEIFTLMGGHVRLDSEGLSVRGPADGVEGIDMDLREAAELTPVIAAVAALATTPSYLRGVGHIRKHETDRIAGLVTEINNLGGDARELEDGLEIHPRPLHGGVFRSYADHRMAQAGAVIGLAVQDVQVEDIGTTSKTLPDFPGMWEGILA